VVEPGVTYGQLTAELAKHNLRVMMPLGVPESRSVISCVTEANPPWPPRVSNTATLSSWTAN